MTWPEIRAYRADDLEPVLSIWTEAIVSAQPPLSKAFLDEERENLRTLYLPRATTKVALAPHLCGFVSVIGQDIAGLFVAPEMQGRGIGGALLDSVLPAHDMLSLEVFEKNLAARRFYDRHGFRWSGARVHGESGEILLELRFNAGSSSG